MLAPQEVVHSQESCESLVQRIRAGDRGAETDLVRRYSRVMLFMLQRRVSDRELARDLLQESFMTALLRLRKGELDEPRALPGFLRGIALNKALGQERLSERQRIDYDMQVIDAELDSAASAHERMEQSETVAQVRRVIGDMKVPRDRELLLRYFLTNEAKSSICAALKLNSEHFDRVLHRARRRLKGLMQARYGGPGGNVVEI
jgi:RNA polymerase sigma-70 factor (ECF subfamily)